MKIQSGLRVMRECGCVSAVLAVATAVVTLVATIVLNVELDIIIEKQINRAVIWRGYSMIICPNCVSRLGKNLHGDVSEQVMINAGSIGCIILLKL